MFEVAYKTKQTLYYWLAIRKDEIEKFETSGINKIKCDKCNKKYYGQNWRAILTRYGEHLAHIEYCRTEKSSVAHNVLNSGYPVYTILL